MTGNESSFRDAISSAMDDILSAPVEEVAPQDEPAEVESEEILESEEDTSEDDVEVEAESEVEAEGEEPDEETEEEGDGSNVVTLDDEDEVIIDGESVKVKDALLRQADYTKKTQALADERKAFEAEREGMAAAAETMKSLDEAWGEDQGGVVATFLANSDDPVDAVADAIEMLASDGTVDANMFVVRTIVNLISQDLLEDDLREMLGFDDEMVAKAKQQAQQDRRISKLERQTRKAPEPVEPEVDREAAVAEAREALAAQWQSVVEGSERLSGADENTIGKIRSEVAQIALDRGGIPLDVAFDLWESAKQRDEAKAAAEAVQKKRTTQAVSKPSNSAPAAPTRKPGDLRAAVEDVFRELGGQ
jgi:hypothetical protein